MPGDRSDHQSDRRLERRIPELVESDPDGTLFGSGTPLDGQNRGGGRQAGGQQPGRDRRPVGHPHQNDDGPARFGQGLPVGLPIDGMAAVAGYHRERGRQTPVGDRHPGVGGHGHRGGDAGHHLERHPGRLEGQYLLTAPPEDEGIAALQADDPPTGSTLADQEGVDLVLFDRTAGLLPDVDPPGRGRSQVQEAGVGQPVVHDHLGAAQQLRARARSGARGRRARRPPGRRSRAGPVGQVGPAGGQKLFGQGGAERGRGVDGSGAPRAQHHPAISRGHEPVDPQGVVPAWRAARAPTGRSHPPPRRARNARSAVTAR